MAMSDHEKIVRSEFGRLRGVTPEQASERADALAEAAAAASGKRADAMDEKAEALREWAADFEAAGDEEAAEVKTAASARRPGNPKRASSAAPAGRRGTKRSGGKIGASVRRAAIGRPVDAVAGTVDSAGSAFWQLVGVTLVAVLLYRALTFSTATVTALQDVDKAVRWVVYPPAAFPEKHASAKPAPATTRLRLLA